MPGNARIFSPENSAYRAELLAEIGRRLREAYATEQPLPERLAKLMRRIDQLPERQFEDVQFEDVR